MTKVIEVEGIGKVEVEFSLKANREIQIKGKDVLVRMKEFPPQSTPGAGYIVSSMLLITRDGTKHISDGAMSVVFEEALKPPIKEGMTRYTSDEVVQAWIASGKNLVDLVEEVIEYFRELYPIGQTMARPPAKETSPSRSKSSGKPSKEPASES